MRKLRGTTQPACRTSSVPRAAGQRGEGWESRLGGPAAAVWAEGSVPVVLDSRALNGARSLGTQQGKRLANSRWGKRHELQCGVSGVSLDRRFQKASGEGGANWTGNGREVGSGGCSRLPAQSSLQAVSGGTTWGPGWGCLPSRPQTGTHLRPQACDFLFLVTLSLPKKKVFVLRIIHPRTRHSSQEEEAGKPRLRPSWGWGGR